MNWALDIAQGMAALGLGGAFALAALGLWNVYLARLMSDAAENRGSESLLRALQRVLLRRTSAFNERVFSKAYQSRIRVKLLHAGDPADLTPPEFIGLQEVSLAAFTVLGLLLVFSLEMRWFWAVVCSLVGWFYPQIWLSDVLKKRHHQITRALPYNLDLLTLSVEAGLDFAQAVGKVVEKGRQGPLTEELGLMLKNIKLGKTREEALRMMSERVGLDPLTQFCNSLIQADRMGTSLGKVLRIQSSQMRSDRTQRAEKLANEAPVKMLLPLIGCIFPTVFLVLFGPIAFQMIFNME